MQDREVGTLGSLVLQCFVSSPACAVLLDPPFQHSLSHRAGLSPHRRNISSSPADRDGPAAVPEFPSTHKLGQPTSISRYRTATTESWLAGHGLSWPVPTVRLPSFQSPTAGPPAHIRTAIVAVLSLKCHLPSAVSTFGPDEFGPALARLLSCSEGSHIKKASNGGVPSIFCHVPPTLMVRYDRFECASTTIELCGLVECRCLCSGLSIRQKLL